MKLNVQSSANQVAVFFVVLGFNIVFFTFFTSLTATLFFGMENLQSAGALRYISSLQQLIIYGLTAFECAYLFYNKNAISYLQLNKGISVWTCFLFILIAVVSLPAMSCVITWNENIHLPQSMSSIETWMRNQEDATAEIVTRLLSGNSVGILCLNLVVMAIMPAVCEEFLFRGLLITWIKKQLSNTHVVIFISAFIFSAIHVQFYGFVPRFLLGLYLGYLFMWTGSIWASIVVHFINNAMAVMVSFLFNNQLISTEYQHFGDVGENYWLIALSVLLTTACICFLYRKKRIITS